MQQLDHRRTRRVTADGDEQRTARTELEVTGCFEHQERIGTGIRERPVFNVVPGIRGRIVAGHPGEGSGIDIRIDRGAHENHLGHRRQNRQLDGEGAEIRALVDIDDKLEESRTRADRCERDERIAGPRG